MPETAAMILDDKVVVSYAKSQGVYNMLMTTEETHRRQHPTRSCDRLSTVVELGGVYYCYTYFFRQPFPQDNGWSLLITSLPQIVGIWESDLKATMEPGNEEQVIIFDEGRKN